MQRAVQTAEIINSILQIPYSTHNELSEVRMGTLAGKAWTEMKNGMELKNKHRSIQYDYTKLGGESAVDVKKRVLKFLKEISSKHKDYQVLIITHGGIVRLLHLLEHKKPLVDEIENVSVQEFDLGKILKLGVI